ncbi:MAG: hydantoinase/oxoprolinase family protein [archaeon]|nr:hydantoinase/oxoprolinase family protein [archaeon]
MLYIGIDVGGTFTDVLVFDDETKNFAVNKVLTTKRIEEGIVDALRNYSKRSNEVGLISHSTTVATNALLTHTGLAHTALITNEGFRDVLEIGRQRRAELYDLENKRPVPLVRRRDRFTLNGRILSDGSEEQPLSKSQLRKMTRLILEGGYESVVVAFLNSYANQKHEIEVSHFIKNAGFGGHIDISSEVSREYREYERFSTAVVNACLSPLVSSYLANLSSMLKKEKLKAPIYVMNSDGSASTIRNSAKYPVLMIESGPAAGVLASRYISGLVSLPNILTFDMGGTTAKAGAVVNYEPDVAYEFEAAGQTHSGRSIKGSGYPVRAPFIDLAEVSAGGGTIAWVDDAGALKVGPKSAGSDPGPAVYGKGGKEPTVTDANVVLGRINPDFLLGGAMRLDRNLGFDSLRTKIAERLGMNVQEAAQGIIRIVNNTMARAISIVSVERGRDPRDFSLIAFGGAGPIHACDLAEELEISRIVLPEHAGLFSAYGLLTADLERNFVLPVMKDLSNAELDAHFSKLRHIARKTLEEEDIAFSRFKSIELVDARYHGQSYQIPIRYSRKGGLEAIKRQFNARHKELYGYSSNDEVEIVSTKLRAIIPSAKPKLTTKGRNYLQNAIEHSTGLSYPSEVKTRRAWLSGKYHDVRAFSRDLLEAGSRGKGPCIIEEYDSTAVINPSWYWKIDRYRNIILTRNKTKGNT